MAELAHIFLGLTLDPNEEVQKVVDWVWEESGLKKHPWVGPATVEETELVIRTAAMKAIQNMLTLFREVSKELDRTKGT